MSRLANPVFNGAPTDELVAVDVYEATTPEVRNAYISGISSFGQSLDKSLGRYTSVLKDVGKSVQGKPTDLADVSHRLNTILKGGRNSINDLSHRAQQTLLSEIGEQTFGHPIRVGWGDDSVDLGYGNLNNATAVSRMLYDITGSELFDVLDMGAEAALFRTTLEVVNEWGVPELVDMVLDHIEDERMRKQLASRSIRTVVNVGDIDTIEVYMNKVGAGVLVSEYPDLPRLILQQYRFKPQHTPANYPALLDQLVRVLDQLQPNWITTQRDGLDVANLSIINTASDAARLLLLSHSDYRTPVLIAPNYPTRDFRTIVRGMYPNIAFGF